MLPNTDNTEVNVAGGVSNGSISAQLLSNSFDPAYSTNMEGASKSNCGDNDPYQEISTNGGKPHKSNNSGKCR